MSHFIGRVHPVSDVTIAFHWVLRVRVIIVRSAAAERAGTVVSLAANRAAIVAVRAANRAATVGNAGMPVTRGVPSIAKTVIVIAMFKAKVFTGAAGDVGRVVVEVAAADGAHVGTSPVPLLPTKVSSVRRPLLPPVVFEGSLTSESVVAKMLKNVVVVVTSKA